MSKARGDYSTHFYWKGTAGGGKGSSIMRTLVVSLLVFMMCAFAASAWAKDGCTIKLEGIDYIDSDCDGVRDFDAQGQPVDNCRQVPNGNCDADPQNCDADENGTASEAELAGGDQLDWNDNGVGDACDDPDKDGIPDYRDNCRMEYNPNQGAKDCVDSDHDGIEDNADNCPDMYNKDQKDSDKDTFGDACDNCVFVANEDQDPEACPYPGYKKPAEEDDAAPPVPGTGVGYGNVPEHVEGGGGCAIVPATVAAPWMLTMIVAAVGIVAARRRMR